MKLKHWSETGVKTLLSYKSECCPLCFRKESLKMKQLMRKDGFRRQFYRDRFKAEIGSQDDKRIVSHTKKRERAVFCNKINILCFFDAERSDGTV
jgi:hypothetical protein